MTRHFHPQPNTPGILDFILCALGVSVLSVFAAMMVRAGIDFLLS